MKKNKKYLEEFYSVKEITDSALIAIALTIVLLIPVVLVNIQLYYLFLMRPYLLVTVTVISIYLTVAAGFFIWTGLLKSIRKADYDYYKNVFIDLLIVLVIFIIVYLFLILYIIPKFVL